MLFLVTQTHTPETCPSDAAGGCTALFDDPTRVKGIKVHTILASHPNHLMYFLIECDDYAAIEKFLQPGFKRCTAKITPVDLFYED